MTIQDVSMTLRCAVCGGDLEGSTARANGQPLCARCVGTVERELQVDAVSGSDLFTGFLGGFVGAIAGAAAWAALELSTNYQVGWVAFGVGWLVGQGTKLGSGNKRAVPLQVIAAACSVIGIFFSHYFTYAHPRKEALAAMGTDVSYFADRLLAEFVQILDQVLSPWDLLWVAFAAMAAWKIVAPPKLNLESR